MQMIDYPTNYKQAALFTPCNNVIHYSIHVLRVDVEDRKVQGLKTIGGAKKVVQLKPQQLDQSLLSAIIRGWLTKSRDMYLYF